MLRPSLLCVVSLALVAACRSGTEAEPPGPAAQVVAASDTVRAGFVGSDLQDSLAVRVVDARGRGVPGHSVTWMSFGPGGTVSPRESLTDERGRARSAFRPGTRAGDYTAVAQAVTVDGPLAVRFRVVAAPAAVAAIQISPSDAYLAVDETRQFTALRIDAYGNSITDRPVAWSSSNPGIVSIDGQSGMARGVAVGTAEITATSEGKSARTRVSVAAMSTGEDLFDTNTLERYTQFADVPASWSIAQGILTAQGLGEQSMLVRNEVLVRDGWVEAEMDRADEGGLVLRFQDRNNLYLLSIHDDGSLLGHRNLELFRRSGGRWVLLAYGRDITWPRGVAKKIRFEAAGHRLRAYADGTLVVEVTDTAIQAAGRVGMRYHDVPEAAGTDMARYFAFRWAGL